ncbi:MAG: endopeptidase La [Prevotellaceae bacterium]|nr:endopeptidase La [Prevotellaceae bacterium]
MMHADMDGEMPVLCVRDSVLFPGTMTPVTIGRSATIKTLKQAEKGNGTVAVFCQKDASVDQPDMNDLYTIGVVGKLVHFLKLPDGNYTALIHAANRTELLALQQDARGYHGTVEARPDVEPTAKEEDTFTTMLVELQEKVKQLALLTEFCPQEFIQYIENMQPSSLMLNVICSYLPVGNDVKHEMLSAASEPQRAEQALAHLNGLMQLARLRKEIERRTQKEIDKQQREYFLSQEIRQLQNELGNKDDSSVRLDDQERMKQEAKDKKWSKKVKKTFEQELAKLNRINIQAPDYNVQLNYLQTILRLPWDYCTKDSLDLKRAENRLNKDHYGMEKVKERILEHLAVLKLKNDLKSPIICLYGPPGVGKTSLGKSIAAALNRNYVRISLGGMHDESEIRGHRRTYIGAMPGRIIKGIQKAGSSNPVFILDEIDKVTENTVNGDPSSALLEVLDPEQNSAFHDNFLDMDYDLSRVMFIATANNINAIPRPLLDRMELIEVGGYITEEKVEIARRHLLPKAKADMGLDADNSPKVGKEALEFIIERYTRESGVRGLEKQISKLLRKVALNVARGTDDQLPKTITPACVEKLLGNPPFNRDKYQGNRDAGVVTGLAWTSVGGEILFIETSLSQGKGGKLTLTGNLGDVMKESAMLALEYIKAHADLLGIDMRIFDNYNIHIHVPEGAVPKDGPSAGVTIATSIASALTQRTVRDKLAMTGEITLRGKVLPVGGIREKILAAKRAGITDIMLCQDNEKDIQEIPEVYLKGLNFHYVKTVSDVWDFALLQEKVANPINFHLDDEKKEEKKA